MNMNTLKSVSLIWIWVTFCQWRLKRMLFLPVLMIAGLAGSGCVHFNDAREPETLPKPASATDTKQFEGVFTNQNLKATNYRSGVPVTDLYDFITGRRTTNGMRGSLVGIRASEDGSDLHIRLLDGQGMEIAATDLHRGSDFDLTSGNLILYGPFSGNHGARAFQ